MPRPIIAVLGQTETSSHGRLEYSTHKSYFEAVWKAGGYPILLPNLVAEEAIQDFPFDGLLCTGGCDINPSLYNEAPDTSVGEFDHARDWLESRLVEKVLAADLPILCICRGMQMLNVVKGGSLYQDLPTYYPSSISHQVKSEDPGQPVHDLQVISGSQFGDIIGTSQLPMNSRHHQGVHRLGNGLVAAATTEDNLIEAIEAPEQKFVIGVQGHPEDLVDRSAPALQLFQAFVAATQ